MKNTNLLLALIAALLLVGCFELHSVSGKLDSVANGINFGDTVRVYGIQQYDKHPLITN